MYRHASIAVLATAVFATTAWAHPDLPQVSRLRPERTTPPEMPAGQTLPVLPSWVPTATLGDDDKKEEKAERLQPMSRLALVRYVYGEFARAVRPLPTLKKGFRFKADKPLDEQALQRAVAQGSAANPGDTVQITGLEFKDKEIVVMINGGAKKKKKWRDRIQVSIGTNRGPTMGTNTSATPGFQPTGSTLILDFGRPVPDMTPDEFKEYLGRFLDFSKQRSASVQWFETLEPEVQEAIKEKRAVVGMDREMVIAAMGRPDQKVRERDADGNDTEDWIYGQPPGKTIFVKFIGDRVVEVREFPK